MRRIPLLALLTLAAISCAEPETLAFRLNEQGTLAYKAGSYEEALSFYRQAQVARPDYPELNINAGSALYKNQEYDRAVRELRRTLTAPDAQLKARAHYALGNTLYRMDEFGLAFEEYKWALRLDPNDSDAKHNLELVLRELQANMRAPQQGVNQESPNSQDPQVGEENQDGEQQPGGQPLRGANSGAPPTGQQGPSQQGDALSRALLDAPGNLAIEDAIRILDALQDRQQAVQAQWNRGSDGRPRAAERDW